MTTGDLPGWGVGPGNKSGGDIVINTGAPPGGGAVQLTSSMTFTVNTTTVMVGGEEYEFDAPISFEIATLLALLELNHQGVDDVLAACKLRLTARDNNPVFPRPTGRKVKRLFTLYLDD